MLRIQFERDNKRWSQRDVGLVAHIPQPTISLIESGRLQPTPEQLQRLAELFRVPPTELLRDVAVLGPSR